MQAASSNWAELRTAGDLLTADGLPSTAPSTRLAHVGFAIGWAGWGALAANRFAASVPAHPLLLSGVVAGLGIVLVVAARIQRRTFRSGRRTSFGGQSPRALSARSGGFGVRAFYELIPEAPSKIER